MAKKYRRVRRSRRGLKRSGGYVESIQASRNIRAATRGRPIKRLGVRHGSQILSLPAPRARLPEFRRRL